jgi:hypothetical protein
MQLTAEPKYEDQFTAFIDLLGFKEFITRDNFDVRTEDERTKKTKEVLDLLTSLSSLRGEFDVQSTPQATGKTHQIKPAISTFSDHIVISYPLDPISADTGFDDHGTAVLVMWHFNQLLTRIAAAALRIGFLLRGGATIGKLYHARGIVFGEALVDAYEIESRTSIYPRVVLSHQITSRPMWIEKQANIMKDYDGLYHFDYFTSLWIAPVIRGDSPYASNPKAWLENVIGSVTGNLAKLGKQGKLNELAKWAWFAREFRSGLERQNPELLKALGVCLDAIPWPK